MDWLTLTCLVVGTVIIYLVSVSLAGRRSLRLKLALIAVLYLFYSGLGIAADAELSQKYPAPYFLFFAFLCAGVLLGGGRQRSGRSDERPPEGSGSEPTKWWSDRTATLLAAGYLTAILGQVAASASLTDLLQPGQVLLGANTAGAVFDGRIARAGNSAYVLLSYVKLLCLPFFYIELQRRFGGRWLIQFMALFAVTYVQVAAANQWGRAAWVQPILVWLLILLAHRRITFGRFATATFLGYVTLVPILNAVAAWRSRLDFSIAGSLEGNLFTFAAQEFSYPRYYPAAEAMGATGDYVEKYLTWLFTLPIPSSFTGDSFSVTRDFSESILGIPYGKGGFYVLLPSWLGESFIAFGEGFALWGLIVGTVIGLLDRFLSQTRELLSLDAFVTGLLVICLRSVSQEFISQAVGCLWILILLFVLRRLGVTAAPEKAREKLPI